MELSHCRRSLQPKEEDAEGRNGTRTTNCCPAPATARQLTSNGVHCGDAEGYETNYLIALQAGIIVDIEATPAHRAAEVDSTKLMVDRVEEPSVVWASTGLP